jgi:hypothetical protein
MDGEHALVCPSTAHDCLRSCPLPQWAKLRFKQIILSRGFPVFAQIRRSGTRPDNIYYRSESPRIHSMNFLHFCICVLGRLTRRSLLNVTTVWQ